MNKLRILLLALAYACFWALFVLFPYPSNVVPESYTSYDAAPVFASSVVTLVTMALSGGVLVALRDGLAERVAGSTMAVVGSGAALLACGAALIVSAHIGAIPLWLMVAYPAIMAIYGVVAAVALAFLSFLIGEAIVALTDPLPTGEISNPLMPALGGVFLVILGRLGRSDSDPPSPPRPASSLSGRAAALAAAILLCYLLGSGAFMSLSSVARGETWFSDGWIHCAIALGLYPAFCLCAFAAWRQGRAGYPWLGFFILCIACLYCTALLYAPLAVLCRALILSSRPMAIMLLWVAVQEGMRARGLPWWQSAVVAPMLTVAVDCAIHAIGLVGLPSAQMDSVVNAVMLVTAFVMTLGMLWFVRLRLDGTDPARSGYLAGAIDVSAVIAALADEHGLSERESEVLGLLYRGNTQKKIAERLFLSVNSIQTYAKSLYRKLGVHSRQELIDMVNEAVDKGDRAR